MTAPNIHLPYLASRSGLPHPPPKLYLFLGLKKKVVGEQIVNWLKDMHLKKNPNNSYVFSLKIYSIKSQIYLKT